MTTRGCEGEASPPEVEPWPGVRGREMATAPEVEPRETFSDFRPGQEQHQHLAAPTDFGPAQLEEPNFMP